MNPNHVHISRHISKLGVEIPSVNLPAGCTCRPDAPCFKKCYARHGRFCFQRNKAYLQNNLELWCCEPKQYEYEIDTAAFFHKYFRWHSSGDIPDAGYLEMMVRVARNRPSTRFLAFTKKFELVNRHINEGDSLPENLTIVFSAWGNFLPDNPHNLPVAYIRFKNEPTAIPETTRACPSYCGDCVSSGLSCWDLQHGQSVVFDEH